MAKLINKQTYVMQKRISISQTSSIAGPMEANGPLGKYFDICLKDDLINQKSYEYAESLILAESINLLMQKANKSDDDIDLIVGGDLLNQITATTFAVKHFDTPYWGIYNACASFVEGLQIASLGIESGALKNVIVTSSSHYSTSERQYRTPLELGSQPPVTSQRTVTASGSCLLNEEENMPRISEITIGKIVDLEQNDPYDMGSAMAPAAVDTILNHFKNTSTDFSDYDLVVTGDLANEGFNIAKSMLKGYGYEGSNFTDCGKVIFDTNSQGVNNGGSGAGCCCNVFNAYYHDLLKRKKINKMLFVATGALLSTTSSLQKQNIPCIAHAVVITND